MAGFLPTPTVSEAVRQKYQQALNGDYPQGERLDRKEFSRLCQCLHHIYGEAEVTREVTRFATGIEHWWSDDHA